MKHHLITERAVRLLADQRVVQARLDGARRERAKTEASTRHALILAAHEERYGNQDRARSFKVAAEAFAHRQVVVDHEIEDLQGQCQAATEASEQAKGELDASAAILEELRSPCGRTGPAGLG